MTEWFQSLGDEPLLLATLTVVGSIIAAYVVEIVISRTLVVMARKTETELDDQIIEILRRPIFLSVIFAGLWIAATHFGLEGTGRFVISAGLKTLAVLVWTLAVMRVGTLLIHSLGGHPRTQSVLQPRTVPVFDMAVKVSAVAVAVYFVFVSWHIDPTAWLASAGILGIAVGFAAKDTLGNLFSGIFILADGHYKLGDWIIIDGTIRGNLRGKVTHIGMRSTRILTRDDVEITVPNALVANSQLINEMGGPTPLQRVRIAVDVAYGSDVDKVREVLLTCAEGYDLVEKAPPPQVRFRRFGNSGLAFELLVWLHDAGARGVLIDQMNMRVYKAFAAAGIEIPYSKHDVFIKQWPGRDGHLPPGD